MGDAERLRSFQHACHGVEVLHGGDLIVLDADYLDAWPARLAPLFANAIAHLGAQSTRLYFCFH